MLASALQLTSTPSAKPRSCTLSSACSGRRLLLLTCRASRSHGPARGAPPCRCPGGLQHIRNRQQPDEMAILHHWKMPDSIDLHQLARGHHQVVGRAHNELLGHQVTHEQKPYVSASLREGEDNVSFREHA